jgi:serine/threonine protein kinase
MTMAERPVDRRDAITSTTTPVPDSKDAVDWVESSDVDTGVGAVPSFRAGLPTLDPASDRPAWAAPEVGDRVDDFVLLGLLGKGSFARVFLAQQTSLGRQVALKVSANAGSEARTLASLEHDHIVHVFSESVSGAGRLRLLCMQFVPGTDLHRVIGALGQRDSAEWNGALILELVDALSKHPVAFEACALRDREFLASCDFVEAVCWLGARLAEALAYAHANGVLHRDIKPANILLNRYGRPLLADFNIACDAKGMAGGNPFGGTVAYMAPEHLEAFGSEERSTRDAVDQRSDVFSLGVVLFELLTGRLPFHLGGFDHSKESVRALAAARRQRAPAPSDCAAMPGTLDRVVRRCLDPEPARRYQEAGELARALDGCRELRRIERNLPSLGPWARFLTCWPFAALMILAFLPHVLGSIVNVSYNAIEIMGSLGESQKAVFFNELVPVYNLVLYPLCLWLCYRLVAPAFRVVRELERSGTVDSAQVADARRRLLALPLWVVGLSCLGWLPGAILFPAGIQLLAGSVSPTVFGHFLISFTISGLIALTYCFFGVELIVLRVLYPRLWLDAYDLRAISGRELNEHRAPFALSRKLARFIPPARLMSPFALFQILAGLIPLAGAVLMVCVGGEGGWFRVLVTSLIVLGGLGFMLASWANTVLTKTVTVFVGTDVPERRRGTS